MSMILVLNGHALAQDASCGVDPSDLNPVLDSRFGQGMEYSQAITTGVAFILHEECDSSLAYFRTAYGLFPSASVGKVISSLEVFIGKNAAAAVSETAQVATSGSSASAADRESIRESASAVESTGPATESPSAAIADEAVAVRPERKSFSSADLATFQSKGLAKVKRLTEYLNIISDRSTPMNTSMSTIESAVALFDGEDHQVEVSSLKRPDKSRFPIRTYFNRLRMLSYTKVVIEGASFTYVSSFRKGPDGKYYGIARFRQTFTGYKDNKPIYSDVTTKTVTITLMPYQKAMEGESLENWDVFLGDISVTQTER
ncbi:MAG: hypothetical protein ACKO1U_02800 [Bacteroidota bacterium]